MFTRNYKILSNIGSYNIRFKVRLSEIHIGFGWFHKARKKIWSVDLLMISLNLEEISQLSVRLTRQYNSLIYF